MRAAIFVEPHSPLSVENVTPIEPGPHDVVVRITASGICHSDLSVIDQTFPMAPPVILGHEGTGVVEEVGSSVTQFAAGDRVIGSFTATCGACWWCRNGETHLCELTLGKGADPRATRADGSTVPAMIGLGTFADAMTCHEMSLVKVETDLPDEQLALIGCGVTTGVGAALNTARVRPGSSVAVLGCGGVGQAVIQGSRIAGAARIIAIDPVALKRDTALALGATDVVDPGDGDVTAQVLALTSGRGTDYAFEVIGRTDTILDAFNCVRPGGTAVAIGVPSFDQPISIPSFPLILQEKNLAGCMYGSARVRRDFPRFIELIETGRLDVAHMVSRTIGLGDINEGFRSMQAGEVIRTVIR